MKSLLFTTSNLLFGGDWRLPLKKQRGTFLLPGEPGCIRACVEELVANKLKTLPSASHGSLPRLNKFGREPARSTCRLPILKLPITGLRERIRSRVITVLGCVLILFSGGAVSAQDAGTYPNRPVMLIVPFAPGGASDFVARVIQQGVSEILGQQIVVDNRPGAAGIIGTEAAARAAPDGYTAFLGNIGTISINPGVYAANMRVKPDKDLSPVTICADTPSILITRRSFPANTVGELIAYVKANPGKLAFASPGSSTLNRLEMEVFKKDAGIDIVHVPYKGGAGPAVTDVLGGHVDMMFTTLSSALQFVKDNQVKALAVTTRERIADLPDVPTMSELGWNNIVTSSWQGVMVPTGTPRPIVDKLYAAIVKVLADPQIQERMQKGGALAVSSKSPEEFKNFIDGETAKWTTVIQQSGVRAD